MKAAEAALGAGRPPGVENKNMLLLQGHGRHLRPAATRAFPRQEPLSGFGVETKNASLQRQPVCSPLPRRFVEQSFAGWPQRNASRYHHQRIRAISPMNFASLRNKNV